MSGRQPLRHLVLVLGDQLDMSSSALDGFDRSSDAAWMAEVAEESTRVWNHKARIAIFLAAMRRFRDDLRNRGFRVEYRRLDDRAATGKYIQRMSNCCAGCRYDPAKSTGADACPFTTLYWDFLLRDETFLRRNQRMALQLRNLGRLGPRRRAKVRAQADKCKAAACAASITPGAHLEAP